MLHETSEESSRVADCLPGPNHFGMSGYLSHSPDVASFAGLVYPLYGRVDYLINCEDAAVEVQGLNCPHVLACPFCWSMLLFPAP